MVEERGSERGQGKNGTQSALVSRLLLGAAGALPPRQGLVRSNDNTPQSGPLRGEEAGLSIH